MKSLEFEKVSVDDARKVLEGPKKGAGQPDHSGERIDKTSSVLQPATIAWLAQLPDAARPNQLAQRFPRIANSIAESWRQVSRCENYLDTLVVDGRGDRRGFPLAVAMELTKLRNHYSELHPSEGSTWDLVARDK